MVLDTSALIAVMLAEPGHQAIRKRMLAAPLLVIGAPTLVEAAAVLAGRLRQDPRLLLNEFVREANVEVIPFDQAHFDIAVGAFLRFGKGRHRAALNFGDCLTYAVARVAGMPLLYTGKDFSQTDL